MVSRHTVAAGHAAAITTPSSSSSNSSTSSIKPTGWIRSNSASRPVLGDRTNFASSSRSTPLQPLPLPKPSTAQGVARRSTPATSGKIDRQRKLSSFFAPNTAPPAAEKVAPVRSGLYKDSPSLTRARSKSAKVENEAGPAGATGLEDDELEARAAQLLRGRFGSVTRSLTPTRSNTPTRLPSPPRIGSDPDSPRVQRPSALRRVMPPPSPVHQQRPTKSPSTSRRVQATPPSRPPPPAPSSSPPFEPTLMQESLSNFTPLPWEKAHASRAALFQRLAGKSKEQVLEKQKSHMADEVARAHARMQIRSPTAPQKSGTMTGRKTTSQGGKGRMKQAAALAGSPPKIGRPEAVLRSPRSNRRIYALETQMGGDAVVGGRAVSLQPIRMGGEGDANAQRRALSEVRFGVVPSASRRDLSTEAHPMPAEEEEEESETLPLAWPADEDQPESDADAEVEAAIDPLDETQPLPWDEEEDQQEYPDVLPRLDSLTEVPPSDDEDLLLQTVIPSSSSSSSSPSSPSASPSRLQLRRQQPHDQPSPTSKRQRVDNQHLPPRPLHASQSRTPLQQRSLPKFSPITLTSSIGGEDNRFDRVVAALKREERRRNSGMQLNLNAYLSTSSHVGVGEVEQRREGLGEDLQDVLSDDDDGDTTVTRRIEDEAEMETEETQPLAWPESPERVNRPQVRPLQDSSPMPSATQRSAVSSTSSSSGRISLPSESNLDEAGNTQLRSFFRDL